MFGPQNRSYSRHFNIFYYLRNCMVVSLTNKASNFLSKIPKLNFRLFRAPKARAEKFEHIIVVRSIQKVSHPRSWREINKFLYLLKFILRTASQIVRPTMYNFGQYCPNT